MKSIQLHPYIDLGSSVRFLLAVREGLAYRNKPQRTDLSLQEHLERVNNLLETLGLRVTRQAFMGELYSLKYSFDSKAKTSDLFLSASQAEQIVERTRIIVDVLRYEAVSLSAYLVADKRLSIEKLVKNVSGLFGEDVFPALPDLTQYDFHQAGRCIAFELPTSAAFHVLRGTEGVLKTYHAYLVPHSSLALPMWGNMVGELRKITSDPPPKELLDNLDNIRVNFRNPTQHPEKVYDIDESQDLFNLCISTINQIGKDLFKRKFWTKPEDMPF